MKLVRFGPRGQEKPGLVTADGRIKDVSAHVRDYDHAFFSGGGLESLRAVASKVDSRPDAASGARLGAPVARDGRQGGRSHGRALMAAVVDDDCLPARAHLIGAAPPMSARRDRRRVPCP